MTQDKVDAFLLTHGKYFPSESLFNIREKLLNFDENNTWFLHSVEYKDATTMLVVSILAGGFGIDRFLVGDVGLGVLKLLTCGLCGIWAIIDWFIIGKRTKEKNLEKLMTILSR